MKDFECDCGRKQFYAPANESGGITEEEAKSVGWEQDHWGDWKCPFCSGNEEKLEKVFERKLDRVQ